MRLRYLTVFIVALIVPIASAQQSNNVLNLNYSLNDAAAPGLFVDPVRAGGAYFYSGSRFMKAAFTLDRTRGTFTYIIAANDTLTHAGVYGNSSGQVGFNAPEGIDADAAGNIYVADTGNGRIVRLNIDYSAGAITYVSEINGLSSPTDVIITGNSFWALFSGLNQVVEYSLSGSQLYSLGGSGSGDGQFSSPRGISARGGNSAQDIYVADTGNDRVVMFTKGASSGSYAAWNAITLPNSDLSDISSDPDGNAYATDRAGGRVHIFGWHGKDYLGYADESFNGPKSISFAAGYFELGITENWTSGSGVSQYYTGVEILNLSASAAGSSVTFGYLLNANAAITGQIKNSGGQVVRNLVTNANLPAYSNHQHIWDGKDNSGNTVPAGQYTFDLTANTSHGQHSNAVSFSWSGGGDTTPPVISNVAATGISSSGATITWTTDEASDSQVEYGLTTSYGASTPLSVTLVTSHSASLSGLNANTLYHYRVKSKDASGNLAVSGDFTFTTTASGDVTPPIISSITATSITSSGATITWATDEASDSQVEYGLTTSYGASTPLSVPLVTNHSVLLSGLSANTLYHFRVKSKDASGNLAISGDFTFTTNSSGSGGNLALTATASASSENVNYGQTANKAIDGVVDGWPGDYTKEWASDGEGSGAWLQLNFASAVTVDRVVLHDRPGSGTQVLAAQLTFSSGSAVSVGELENDGTGVTVTFSARTVTWLRFTVTDAAGSDVGLAEIEVYGSGSGGGDTTPPAISNVAASSISSSTATITWTTNETSDSQVEYGLTTSYGISTSLNASLVTNHSAGLSGLSLNTLYHYRVKSKDASGNLAVSGDFTFTTTASGDVTPPIISSITATSITSSGATITWTTDEASDSQVEYGLTTSYGASTPLSATLVTSHSASLSGLSSNTLYHYRVKSKDASGNLAVSGDFTFTTSSSGGGGGNLALTATASASSEDVNHGQTAAKAIDSVIDGWPGDYTKEWASDGEGAGAWLQLNFPSPVTVNQVIMYDRPALGTQVLGAQLTFSSGSPVGVGALDNEAAATAVTFSSRTITWLRFTVTDAEGSDIGLAEIEVFGPSAAASKFGDENAAVVHRSKSADVPLSFSLSPLYPNPFFANGSATIFQINLPEQGHVVAVIYDLAGHEVKRLHEGAMSPGHPALRWDGKNQHGIIAGTGIYLLRVEFVGRAGKRETAMRRVVLVK